MSQPYSDILFRCSVKVLIKLTQPTNFLKEEPPPTLKDKMRVDAPPSGSREVGRAKIS
ncbi:MAG: hypothetical protein GY705_06675 [Bacteroidetes bacterium]|nr:hypothetical protein [Bacteroidota bacterium]